MRKTIESTCSVPYAFEELFGNHYTLQEKYFYVILCMISDRYADEQGWFICSDTTNKEQGIHHGFDRYGFTPGICKRARKKLIQDGLLEYRYVHGSKGYRIGICYRLRDKLFENSTRATYDAIFNRNSGGVTIINTHGIFERYRCAQRALTGFDGSGTLAPA